MNFLADENLSRRFVNALKRRESAVNIVRVQDIGLLGMDDMAILNWAAENNYILITKDRSTIPPLVAQRIAEDIPTPRILFIRPGADLSSLLSMIDAIVNYSLVTDWIYPVRWIP